jgi:hypothetical protein
MLTVKEVSVLLHTLNVPIIHVQSQTYQKGNLFCVYEVESGYVYKYPISNIFRIREVYGTDAQISYAPRDQEDVPD